MGYRCHRTFRPSPLSSTRTRRAAVAALSLLVAVCALGTAAAAPRPSPASPPSQSDAAVCADLTAKIQEQVFAALVWPKSASIYLSGKLPPAWDPNVAGELQPAGVYNGSTMVRQFFFGYAGPLSTNASQNQDQERIVDVQVVWMACNATSRIVSAETFLNFTDGYGNFIYKTDVIHVYRFNTQGRICGYSLTSKRQEIIIDSRPGSTTPALVIPTVCGAAMALCTGKNQQYSNVTDCIEFMSSIPLGTSADLDQNNVLCRRQYLPMAEMDPNTHCRALGPRGGGRCIDHGLSSQYLVQNFIAC